MSNTGNTQQIIDYGVTANDGTGDPLRTAFIKTDENFDNIWLAGPVGSNITIGNNTIQVNDTNGNLVLKPNGIGSIQVNASIVPDFDQLRDLGSANNRFRSIYVSGGLSLDGNLSVNSLMVADSMSLDGDVEIAGNLTVNGTTLTVNVANLDISDKMIVIANGSPNAASANGAGITIDGANAVIEYRSDLDSITFNKKIVSPSVSTGSITNQFPIFIQSNGNVWEFADSIFYSPQGGSWQSAANTEYISSNPNGFINLISYNNGNLASELYMEHGFVRVRVDNGGPEQDWKFNVNGTTEFPGYTFPAADGNVGEILKTYGNGVLYWTSVVSDYGNANVAAYLPTYTGNITANTVNISSDLYVKTGTFTGDTRGDNSIYAGYPTFTFLGSDVVAQFSGNVNQYTQFNFQNYNSGPMASGDYVITADNGSDTTHFLNIGLAGSGWDGSQPNSLETMVGPNDGYMYVQDGNLAIGTKIGSNKHIWIFNNTGDLSGPGTFSAKATITPPVALANLIPTAGARAFVNDSNLVANSSTFGSQVSGGGANTVPVWSDGTNWYIG